MTDMEVLLYLILVISSVGGRGGEEMTEDYVLENDSGIGNNNINNPASNGHGKDMTKYKYCNMDGMFCVPKNYSK